MRKITLLLVVILLAGFVAISMSPEAKRSFEAFERRVDAGDPEAQFRMSTLLEKGFDSIPADTVRSLALLRSSAQAGYAPAQNYLGFLFRQGTLLKSDPDSTIYWIRRAADSGDAKAAHNLAFIILDSQNKKDSAADTLALRYLEQAAEAGLPQSVTMLADLYAEGRLVPADTLRAVNLYEKAIEMNFSDAQLRLLNLMGPRWHFLSSEKSLAEALRYWNKGAYTIAAELAGQVAPGNPETARAYALLGHAYSRGMGVPYDYRRANEYFARAAMLGNPAAQFIIAETLEIFPDALSELFPGEDIPSTMNPESLRAAAAAAGITTAEQASEALTELRIRN